jgi:site-specific DNA recombinase
MKPTARQAVIYCRVSDPGQVKNGHGLTSQETRCREFAKYQGLKVLDVFHEEGISGGITDRPAIKRLLAYLAKNKDRQLVVIIDDISRLARSLKAHIELRMAIQDAGGILKSPSIEFGEDSDSQLVENLLASVSQHHRQKNAEQVKNRMRARMTGGYWIMKAPRGYRMEKCRGHGKMLVRDEPVASIIQEGLEGFAYDRFSSVVELQNFFQLQAAFPKDRKGKVHIQRVLDVLNHMIYTGYYEFPKWDIGLMRGKHEPIISFETYTKIQDKLHGNSKAPARQDLNEDFVLRGFVLCDCCGKPMTSCWSKGAYGKYPYYLCRNKSCDLYGKSINRDKVEEDFVKLLGKLTPAQGTIDLMLQLIEEVKDARCGNYKETVENLKKEQKLIERKIEQLVERIVEADSAMLITTYERQIKQLEEKRIVLDEKIAKCGSVNERLLKINRTFLDFLRKPHEYWDSNDLLGKRTVLKATFARPVAYSKKEGYRTPALSQPFSLLAGFCNRDSGLVGGKRFELPTSSMSTTRSNQLS